MSGQNPSNVGTDITIVDKMANLLTRTSNDDAMVDEMAALNIHISEDSEESEMSFEELRPKLLELCRTVCPDANHGLTRIEPALELADVPFYPDEVTHDEGASFDEFRVHMYWCGGAILEHSLILGTALLLPEVADLVPRVVYTDHTGENPLKIPCMVQEWSRGRSLKDTYDGMTQAQKVAVAQELGRVYQKIRSRTHWSSGTFKMVIDRDGSSDTYESIVAREHEQDGGSESNGSEEDGDSESDDEWEDEGLNGSGFAIDLRPFGMPEERDYRPEVDWDAMHAALAADVNGVEKLLTKDNLCAEARDLPARDILFLMFKRRIHRNQYYREKEMREERLAEDENLLKPARAIIETIVERNGDLFGNESDSLIDREGKYAISYDHGTVGWDEATFRPWVLGCRAPDWLWRPKEQRSSDDDNDNEKDEEDKDDNDSYGSVSCDGSCADYPDPEPLDPVPPTDPAGAEIKRAFDAAAGERFQAAAYNTDLVFARRILDVVRRGGDWSICDTDELQRLLEEWNERNNTNNNNEAKESAD
ncbi:hypothetical protein PG988_007976 [Apiospora saccharicola]